MTFNVGTFTSNEICPDLFLIFNCRKTQKSDPMSTSSPTSHVDNDYVLPDPSRDNNGYMDYDYVTPGSVVIASPPPIPGHVLTPGGDEYAVVDKSRDTQDETSLVDNVEYVSDIRSRDNQDEMSMVDNSEYDTFHQIETVGGGKPDKFQCTLL